MINEVKKNQNEEKQNKDCIRPSVPLFVGLIIASSIMTIFSSLEVISIFRNNKENMNEFVGVIIFLFVFILLVITLLIISIKFLSTKLEFNDDGIYYKSLFKHSFFKYSDIKEYGFAREAKNKGGYDLYLIREQDDYLVVPLTQKAEVKANIILEKYKDKFDDALYIDHHVIKRKKEKKN